MHVCEKEWERGSGHIKKKKKNRKKGRRQARCVFVWGVLVTQCNRQHGWHTDADTCLEATHTNERAHTHARRQGVQKRGKHRDASRSKCTPHSQRNEKEHKERRGAGRPGHRRHQRKPDLPSDERVCVCVCVPVCVWVCVCVRKCDKPTVCFGAAERPLPFVTVSCQEEKLQCCWEKRHVKFDR